MDDVPPLARRKVTRRKILSGAASAAALPLPATAGFLMPPSAAAEPVKASSAASGRSSFVFARRDGVLPGAFTHSGDGARTMRTMMTYEGQLIGGRGPRVNERGLQLEPAATNLIANARLRGGTASGNGRFDLPVSVTFATTQNSNLLTVYHRDHGYTAGDRVHCLGAPPPAVGGVSIRNRPENAYNITRVIDADRYELAHWRAATVEGASAAFSMVRAAAPTQILPAGWSKKGDAESRRFLVRAAADNTWSATTGARRELQISGWGIDYLYLSPNIAVAEGEPIAFSLPVYGMGNAFVPDSFQLINLTLELALEWRDSQSRIVGETLASLNDQSGSYVFERARVIGVAPRSGFVRVAIKASGAHSSDCCLLVFEPMASKTSWAPLVVLPPPGAMSEAPAPADRIAPYRHDTDIRTVAVAFDIQEIVGETDGILSIGGIEIKAVGSRFPRDLVVSDSTNSVALPGAITRQHKTQGYNRVAVSWGSFGVRLAHVDGPVAAATASSAVFDAAAASRLVRIGRLANDGGASAIVIKELSFSDQPADLAELAALATPLRFFPPDKPVPLRDFPVGRTSKRPLKRPGIDAAPDPFGAGPTWRVLGARIAVTAAASKVTVSDWDFRGFHIVPAATAAHVTFEQCIFDDSANAGGHCIDLYGRSTAWAVRHCTFTATPKPGTRFNTWINSQTEAFLVERCAFFGSQSDIVSGGGLTFRENYVRTGRVALAAHPDNCQFLLGRGPILLERNIIDMRMGYHEKAPQNYAIGGSTGLSPVRHFIKFADNMVFGGHNQVAFQQSSLYPVADGEPRWWRSDAQPADGESRILVVRSNFLSMSTANVLTNNIGNCMRIEFPGPITLDGTALEKLGLTAGVYARTVTGHSIASPANTPLRASFRLFGPSPSLGTTSSNGGIAAGETIMVNNRKIAVVAGGAFGDAQIDQTDTIQTLGARIAALVPGAVVSVVPYAADIEANSDPLLGISL